MAAGGAAPPSAVPALPTPVFMMGMWIDFWQNGWMLVCGAFTATFAQPGRCQECDVPSFVRQTAQV